MSANANPDQDTGKKHAVIYCRVSSTKQIEEGHGLDSQEVRCRDYAERKGYIINEVFADKGVSGGDLDRPEMRNMLAYLMGQTDCDTIVLIDDLNRFSRDVRVHWQLRDLVKNAGGILESPSLKFGDTSDDKLIENLLASVSQHQREKNGEQVLNRMKARVMNGYWVKKAIPGYKYKQTKTEGKILIRDEPVASIVQEALEGFASGYFASQAEVQRYLESQPDFPKQKRYGGIRLQKVTDMLTHPLYAGLVLAPTWGISLREGRHEGLISVATFEKIQKRIKDGAYAPRRTDLADQFPLRGYVACGECGGKLTSCYSKSSTGKRHPYYLCQTKDCSRAGKSIRRDKIEGEFGALLKDMRPAVSLLNLTKAMVIDAWNIRTAQMTEWRKAARRSILKIENQVDELLDKLADASSATTAKAYERKIDKLEKERLIIAEKLENSMDQKATPPQIIELCWKFIANPWKAWEPGSIDMKKLVLKLVLFEPLQYCRESGYRTPKTTLPFKLLEQNHKQDCKMVPPAGIEPALR